jgi:hypothetical protein
MELGYLGVSQTKLLIYQVTYVTNANEKTYFHEISTGDFGI